MAHKLDPYKAIIDARLEEFPKLSAKRLFDEVRAAGYPGCYESVRNYVRVARPCEPVEPVVRFETPAGRQGQVDFGTFTLPWGRRHALVVVLGYSRLLWLRFFPRQTMPILMEGLESAFETFGGVPDELLFDQMRAVVLSDDRAAGGGLVLNTEFLRFAAHWGFLPRSCRPYRARTKGKVERPIRYIRESFFYGREFANDNDLNEQAARWLEGTANVRRHATIGEPPVERFERDERAVLLPLANCPYRRLGIRQAPEPAPRRLAATVEVPHYISRHGPRPRAPPVGKGPRLWELRRRSLTGAGHGIKARPLSQRGQRPAHCAAAPAVGLPTMAALRREAFRRQDVKESLLAPHGAWRRLVGGSGTSPNES